MTPTRPKGVKCGAKNRTGGTCRLAAGQGTTHTGFGRCKHHGGASPNGGKAAEKERAAWHERLAGLIDPALDTMTGLLDENVGERARLGAAKDLLDRAGVREEGTQAEGVSIIINWPER